MFLITFCTTHSFTIDITSNGKQFEQPLFGPIKSSEEDVSKDDSNRQDPKTE